MQKKQQIKHLLLLPLLAITTTSVPAHNLFSGSSIGNSPTFNSINTPNIWHASLSQNTTIIKEKELLSELKKVNS